MALNTVLFKSDVYFSNSRLFSYEPLSYPFASSSKSENDFDNLFGESHFDL